MRLGSTEEQGFERIVGGIYKGRTNGTRGLTYLCIRDSYTGGYVFLNLNNGLPRLTKLDQIGGTPASKVLKLVSTTCNLTWDGE